MKLLGMFKLLLNISLLLLCGIGSSQAAELERWPYSQSKTVYSTEYFQWRELLNDGDELLSESGMRWALSMTENNYSRLITGVIYEFNAKGYIGRVAYDGKTQDVDTGEFSHLESSTDYLGAQLLAMGGQRFMRPFMVDLLGGVEINNWLRRLNDATDSSGVEAKGYLELYRVMSARLAAGTRQMVFASPIYLQVGVKYPLEIFEVASTDTTTLFPQRDFSLFASMDITRALPALHPQINLRLYYDSFRFKASRVKDGTYQPESAMDVVGLSIAF
jgi:hypothetical protein